MVQSFVNKTDRLLNQMVKSSLRIVIFLNGNHCAGNWIPGKREFGDEFLNQPCARLQRVLIVGRQQKLLILQVIHFYGPVAMFPGFNKVNK